MGCYYENDRARNERQRKHRGEHPRRSSEWRCAVSHRYLQVLTIIETARNRDPSGYVPPSRFDVTGYPRYRKANTAERRHNQ